MTDLLGVEGGDVTGVLPTVPQPGTLDLKPVALLDQEVSRTFTHRTLAHDWYFIDVCQVNRPF